MKSKLLNKKSIPPACEYCTRGSGAPDGKTVLCPKKGVMQKDSSCSAFRYDPLKRKPKQPVELPQFDASDLSFNQAVFCSPLIDLTAGIM